ncbi:MAG: NAD-dependent isocitrate dehydrogenase [Deltaproteobacteria bacterium]|nr:MAG: NAD-dependent isocitrate dehydrogenase [Deltaproteobacteria bacterium]
MEQRQIVLIEGDGIGPEIAAATRRAVDAAGARVSWRPARAGLAAVGEVGDPLPAETIRAIADCGVAVKGPLGTPVGHGFRSVNVALRQHFDLYANVRPAQSLAGVPSRYEGVDLVIIRENTEGMYTGVEHYIGQRTAAESIAIITRVGSERIARYALEFARAHGRRRVTFVHKANILKLSNGLFLETAREVAAQYPDIDTNDVIVDAAAMKLVVDPSQFDVICTTNLFGDILSDLAAGLVGGLGVAPAANIGDGGVAIFEAVHGTAPDIAGKGIANPTALMLAAALMLDHIGQADAAARLRAGVRAALASDDHRTRDLGGRADTAGFTDAVIAAMR